MLDGAEDGAAWVGRVSSEVLGEKKRPGGNPGAGLHTRASVTGTQSMEEQTLLKAGGVSQGHCPSGVWLSVVWLAVSCPPPRDCVNGDKHGL
jgi:hypothetical protein